MKNFMLILMVSILGSSVVGCGQEGDGGAACSNPERPKTHALKESFECVEGCDGACHFLQVGIFSPQSEECEHVVLNPEEDSVFCGKAEDCATPNRDDIQFGQNLDDGEFYCSGAEDVDGKMVLSCKKRADDGVSFIECQQGVFQKI